MKKIIVFSLFIAMLVSEVFTQDIKVAGRVYFNLAPTFTLEPSGEDPAWSLGDQPVELGATYTGNNFDAKVNLVVRPLNFNMASAIEAWGRWKPGSFELLVGNKHLPSFQPGTLNFMGNSNSTLGASAFTRVPQIIISSHGAYAGLWAENKALTWFDTATINTTGASPASSTTTKSALSPPFIAGYDYTGEVITAGGGFAGWYCGSGDGGFPFVAYLHGKLKLNSFGIGVNAALRSVPMNLAGVLRGTAVNANTPHPDHYGLKAMTLEGFLDLSYAVSDKLSLTGTVGYAHNLAPKDDYGGGNAIQLGADVKFFLAQRFIFIPGVIYFNDLKDNVNGMVEDSGYSTLQVGVTFMASF